MPWCVCEGEKGQLWGAGHPLPPLREFQGLSCWPHGFVNPVPFLYHVYILNDFAFELPFCELNRRMEHLRSTMNKVEMSVEIQRFFLI